MSKGLTIFQGKAIRRTYYNDKWWFSVVDIVAALTDSPTPRQYWGKVKQREFVKFQLSPIWVQLKLSSKDGKSYKTDCVDTRLPGAGVKLPEMPGKRLKKSWTEALFRNRIIWKKGNKPVNEPVNEPVKINERETGELSGYTSICRIKKNLCLASSF
jgi:hypothetical protein